MKELVITMLLGKRLKELRQEKGLSQQALGELINVTKVSICCYEKNTRTPNLETLLDLCEALGTNVSYLLGQQVCVISDSDEEYRVYMDNDEIALLKK